MSNSISAGVDYWLGQPKLPTLPSPESLRAPSTQSLPREVEQAFKKLQNGLFGKGPSVFRLWAFEGDVAFIHFESRTIFINPKIIATLKEIVPAREYQAILTLLLAHEIGHFFYEVQVQFSQNGLSFLNNPSYAYSGALPGSVKARMHGEVDAIGIYLATKAQVDPSLGRKALIYVNQAILKNSKNMISLSEIEIEGRLKVINEYLSL